LGTGRRVESLGTLSHCCHWQQRPSSCYLEIKTDIKNVRYKRFFSFEDQPSFDFKGLLIKLEVTEMVLLSLIITFTIAYQVNIRKEKSIAWKRLFL
jgi:hypothetical protein